MKNKKKSLPSEKRLINLIKKFHWQIRSEVRKQILEKSYEELSRVAKEGMADISYKIDVAASEKFIEEFALSLSKTCPVAIIVEGWKRKVFPEGSIPRLEIIIDPIDGTRGLMYDLRSAWILTGVAVHKVKGNNLSDIYLAVQTEISLTKQTQGSVLWAVKGKGATEEIYNLKTGKLSRKGILQTSPAKSIRHGFACFVDFFPGCKEEIGRLADTVFEKVLGSVKKGEASVFNDQYIANAGQMYLLSTGRYRFIADLRPETEKILNKKGKKLGLAAHPYDICTALIAEEGGAIITDAKGNKLSYPLETDIDCSWIGYANKAIRNSVEPVLLKELKKLS